MEQIGPDGTLSSAGIVRGRLPDDCPEIHEGNWTAGIHSISTRYTRHPALHQSSLESGPLASFSVGL